MAVDINQLRKQCSDLPDVLLDNLIGRLPEDYLERFPTDVAARHLHALAKLSSVAPVQVIVEPFKEDQVACSVVAFDHPFEFSIITGLLSGHGFNIRTGHVYTLPASRPSVQGSRPGYPKPSRLGHAIGDPKHMPVILDVFIGSRENTQNVSLESWAEQLTQSIKEVINQLNKRETGAVEQAKQLVNERVTQQLSQIKLNENTQLYPVELTVQKLDDRTLRLLVTAQDTPAFLYSLSNALSLHGLNIERVKIDSSPQDGHITDEIDLSLPARSSVKLDDKLIEEIRLSTILTKQFTYHLERSPDPYRALTRFEKLVSHLLEATQQGQHEQWLQMMANPHAMRDLAKLLGTSDYLWEEFIRGQYETLEPILTFHGEHRVFTDPPETLPLRLEQALEGAIGLEEQRDRINKFKNDELFRIDLDHILNPAVTFRQFSEHLTLLAENLFASATQLVYEDLVRSYGAPSNAPAVDKKSTAPVKASHHLPYAVFGLGKLGGVALGYASDIEMLFVYQGNPQDKTTGGKRKPISYGEFFEQFAREASQFIRTKQAGIFEVDLRLRPYGKDGALASSVDQLKKYYEPTGPAHAFEKLALVRLRWFAGNPELGYKVEKLRDYCVYETPDDLLKHDELWEIWDRMKQEKLEGEKRPNAKYSPGALVDLEGTVQLLQVQNANHVPQLRTPRLSSAMESLQRAAVLTPVEYAGLRSAYEFYRKLINALRVLRGSAVDLFLPEAGSMELNHVARRMGYTERGGNERPASGEQLMHDFKQHAQTIADFIERHFDRKCPGL